jgi:2-polyprenyl-3-methyl-5-hydroxy-6-metoxy-1,4-benzoquinol methylase
MPSIVYEVCPCCGSAAIVQQLQAKDFTVSKEVFEIWECKDCTLRFTQSVPDLNGIGKYYQSEDYVSHTDSSEGIVNKLYHFVRKRTLKKKQQQVQYYTQLNKGNLLDIGAGTGAFANFMQQAGWTITGLEPDAATRKRAADLYGLQLQHAAALFNLSAGSFDAVTMWHVLEHVHELHPYIDQVKKLLTAKGKAIIAVPNYTSYDAGAYKEFWAAYDVPRHLYHFSPAAMHKLMELHGLKIATVLPMWYDSFYVSMLSEKNMTGSNHLLKAFTIGWMSNVKTVFNRQSCSSLIYVVEKVN